MRGDRFDLATQSISIDMLRHFGHSGLAMRTWKILDRGVVPLSARTMDYECPGCGHSAELPIKGLPIAQLSSGGVIFDNDVDGALPRVIQCRHCRRRYERESLTDTAAAV